MFAATAVHLYHMAEHGMHAGEHCVFVFDDISLCAKQAVRNLATPTILSEEQFFNLPITYGVLVAVIVLLLLQQRVSYVERYRLPPLLYSVLFSSGILPTRCYCTT